jgi:Rap1a immunity proteins
VIEAMHIIFRLTCALAAMLAFGAVPRAGAEVGMGKEPGARLLTRCESARRLADPGTSEGLSSSQRADAQTCLAFLEGFVWGHAWASWREAKDMWFCLPQGFTGEQGVPVVVEYLEAHPDRLLEDGHLLVFLALTGAYPCKP